MTAGVEKEASPRTGVRTASTDRGTSRPRTRRHSGLLLAVWRVLFVAALLAAWQGFSGRIVSAFWISSPSRVAIRFQDWISDGTLLPSVGTTVLEAAYGFGLGAAGGIVFGLVFGQLRRTGQVVEPVVYSLYSLPRIALAPLFILWFGIGLESKVALAAVAVFFLVFYNTMSGVRDVDLDLVNSVRIMGANRRQMMTQVVLPSAMLWVVVGLKVSVPYALVGAVVGEMVASNRGIGFLMQYASGQFDTTGVFVGVVTLMVIAMIINVALGFFERGVMRWKVVARK